MPSSIIGTVGAAVVGGLMSDDGSSSASDASADASKTQAQIAKEQWSRYKSIYAPLEDSVVADATNYDTPEKYAKAAGDASATVSEQFSKAKDRLNRTPGMDTSAPAYSASMTGLNLAQAATDATSQNSARQKVEDTAYFRKIDALSLGKGLPAQASSALASSANNSLALSNALRQRETASAAGAGNMFGGLYKAGSNWLNSGNAETSSSYDAGNYGVDSADFGLDASFTW